MNKTAIRNYAVWARNELIQRVTRKAYEYGIEKDNIVADEYAEIVNGRILSEEEKVQRKQLIGEINSKGYDQVIEEVAYTWFNRFIALRFMEVNNYLPQKVRVFTNSENEFNPQILEEAVDIEIEGVDPGKIFELIENNDRDGLYKLLLLGICNDMGKYLPGMFTKIADYKVLLFPDNLLKKESVLGKLISDIEEDTWLDQVQAIGWMYQYYISEKHNEVVDSIKGKAVRKEDIPAATQLWTTDWVVRYMVDNSLGRYWVERNPNSPLKDKLEYLATSKNNDLPIVDEKINPEDLTFLDPCMGSGHILVYAFDVLMEIYKECGYAERNAAISIIENNLYGLDIDDRAYQLSYFAIMMKARSYNRRIFSKGIKPNIASIQESNNIEAFVCEGITTDDAMNEIGEYLVDTFKDAKELGALITVKKHDYNEFKKYLEVIKEKDIPDLSAVKWFEETLPAMKVLCNQAEILSKKFTIVTTNPPYMNKMEGELKKFVTKNYKDYSSDLFAVFMRRNFDFTVEGGYLGFMTPNVWMFIKSYENLRKYIVNYKDIVTLIQMAKGAFFKEATVDICAFVLSNEKSNNKGLYYRLEDFKGDMEVQRGKVIEAQKNKECGYFYEADESNFSKIPGSPMAYWVSDNFIKAYNYEKLDKVGFARSGLQTGDNNLFLKYWFEVKHDNIAFNMHNKNEYLCSKKKWTPQIKGGSYRKWYGNFDYVLNWENDGYLVKKGKGCRLNALVSDDLFFKKGITWSHTTSGGFGARYLPEGHLFNVEAPTYFAEKIDLNYILGMLNSKIAQYYLNAINATMHYLVGNISSLPIIVDYNKKGTINAFTKESLKSSKQDWDSFETSWDFTVHPLVKNHISNISEAYTLWKTECEDRFIQLKSNEEELNRIFIDIYGLQDELTPEVEDKDVTVYRVFDEKEDIPEEMGKSKYALTKQDVIKSFMSYAVGCMVGRYSLDVEGLAYAGGEWDSSKYKTYIPDEDNIIPICDDEYFQDDIVGRFIDFVKVVYGENTLEENLQFIADALGGKGTAREVIRSYFLNDFYKDHCKTYQKRPIYWLFDSGKKNGFKALVYLHRYKPDTIARLRTQYVFDQQTRYNDQINLLEKQLLGDIGTREKTRVNKELKKFKAQADELRSYEEKVHHYADQMIDIDLDDGVKVNYEKFKDLLAKIK